MEKISTKKLYKKHKKICKNQNKGEALRRSMREIQDLYDECPICAELYYRYNKLKKSYFIIYTIYPQVLLGLITGISAALIVNEIIDIGLSLIIIVFIIILFTLPYCKYASLWIFKSNIRILIEFEIKIIESKIESDFRHYKRIKCKIRSKK